MTEESSTYPDIRQNESVHSLVNTFEWLLIAIILALVFRAFAIEAFQIPTGSMAETLKGAHYHMRCERCGKSYDRGGDSGTYGRPMCPTCGYYNQGDLRTVGLSNGDRIFVLKSIYQFFEPKRWDVVVFKNPTQPSENYIKRLIARPNEAVQLVDGDVYINGQIARKPYHVQQELWMNVFENDYQPFEANPRFQKQKFETKDRQNRVWTQPFENKADSKWNTSADGPTVFSLDDAPGQINTLSYNVRKGNGFRITYAYNDSASFSSLPICSDLMTRFVVQPLGQSGSVGVALEKFGVIYSARVEFGGTAILEKTENGHVKVLRHVEITPPKIGYYTAFEFANVDRRLILRFGDTRISCDLDGTVPTEKPVQDTQPTVELRGSGKLQLRHLGVYRDMYYMDSHLNRASIYNPMELENDEFFCCGDNSPNSSDSRLWIAQGYGNNGKVFREGIVPREFMMGRAVVVYWSDAFKPSPKTLPIIPNIGGFKLIYGGSQTEY